MSSINGLINCCGALLLSNSKSNVKRGEEDGGVGHAHAYTHTDTYIRTHFILASEAQGRGGQTRCTPTTDMGTTYTHTHTPIHYLTHTLTHKHTNTDT
jgi:hypothetical protein